MEEKKDLNKIYKEQYEKTFYEERSIYLKEKAKQDAKKAACRRPGFLGFLETLLGPPK